MSDPQVSPEDQEKIMQFYEEEIHGQWLSIRGKAEPLSASDFLAEVISALDSVPWEENTDSFDKYIERETQYRIVEEAGGRDLSTLNLTPQQYQARRDVTLKEYAGMCIWLMTPSCVDKRRSIWADGHYSRQRLAIPPLTGI